MITDDEVLDAFVRADPARAGDVPLRVDAARYLESLVERTTDVTLTEIGPRPIEPRGHRRWLLTAAAVALVVLAAGAVARVVRDDTRPAAPPPVEKPIPVQKPNPFEVARGFVNAYTTYDTDVAASYLANETTAVAGLENPQDWRLGSRFMEATGIRFALFTCHDEEPTALGSLVRCIFEYQTILDNGGAGSIDVTVRDGKIVATAMSWSFTQDRFLADMWGPFAAWMRANYPHQIDLLYTDASMAHPRITEQSIPQWEKRTREYVEDVRAGATPTT